MIKRHLPLILLFTAVLLGSAPGGEIPDKGKRITQTILLEACRQNETTTLFALKDSHLSVIRNGLAHPEKGVKIGFSSSVLIATGRFSYSSSPLMGLRGEELSGRIYLDELPLLIFATENPPRLMYLRDGSVDMTLTLQYDYSRTDGGKTDKKYYEYIIHYLDRLIPSPEKDPEIYYRLSVLKRRAGLTAATDLDSSWRRRSRSDLVEMIELTSGALAMEESLQISTMKDVAGRENALDQTIRIDSLAPPGLKPHDFAAMLGSRKVEIPSLARCVPHDTALVYFRSIGKVFESLDLARLFQEHLPLFIDNLEAGDDIQKKLMTRLAVKPPSYAKRFYGLAVGQVALVAGDPYFKEGPDAAVIFQVKNRLLFSARIDSFRRDYRKAHSGARETETAYGGIKIRALTSPGGELGSYYFQRESFAVLATSESMARHIADTMAGKEKSAAENLDFRYLMGIHGGPGDVFVYIGDDFVSRIISAPFKIAELRRVNCEANLKLLQYARRLHRLEKGTDASIQDLLKQGYLTRAPLCPHRGIYTIEGNSPPRCSCHGSLFHLKPLSANVISLVTVREAERYRNFVTSYQRYWSRYVDPIGIRLDLGKTIGIRTIILPLIESSEYRMLSQIMGGAPIALKAMQAAPAPAVFHMAWKMTVFHDYREDLSHIQDPKMQQAMREIREDLRKKNPSLQGDPFGWIGGEMNLFLFDPPASGKKNFLKGDKIPIESWLALRISLRSFEKARHFLPLLISLTFPGTEARLTSRYGGYLISTTRVPFIGRLAFCLREDGLWIAPGEHVFALLESPGGTPGRPRTHDISPAGRRGNLELGIHPQNIKTLQGSFRALLQEIYSTRCADGIRRAQALMLLHDPLAWSRKKGAENLFKGYAGEIPRCPLSGVYSGSFPMLCSFHRRDRDQSERYRRTETGLSELMKKLQSVVITLGFTPEGLETRIDMRHPLKQNKK